MIVAVSSRVQRMLALYAPSLVLLTWAGLWALGLRNSTSDVVTLVTLAMAAAVHTYAEVRSRRRRRKQ